MQKTYRGMFITFVSFVFVGFVTAGCGGGSGERPGVPDVVTPEINGGFESTDALSTRVEGWGSNLWDWMVKRSGKAHSGALAIEFSRAADNNAHSEATLFSTRFAVTAGAEYAVSLATLNRNGPMRVRIAWYDMAGACLRAEDGTCSATTIVIPEDGEAYRTTTGVAIVPPYTADVVGDIYITAVLPNGGTAYVDDVSLTPIE